MISLRGWTAFSQIIQPFYPTFTMYATTVRPVYKLVVSLFFIMGCVKCFSQEIDSFRHVQLTLGPALGHYFNSMVNVRNTDMKANLPGCLAKIMWKPEYRLKFGIQSGYYYIYRSSAISTDSGFANFRSDLRVVPVLFEISMNIWKGLELSLSTGYCILSSMSGGDPKLKTAVSMANYSFGTSYNLRINEKFQLGTGINYMFIGKTEDHHLSFVMSLTYNVWSIKIKTHTG